jgi:Gram-negative bacterial TonB protein C-terminal
MPGDTRRERPTCVKLVLTQSESPTRGSFHVLLRVKMIGPSTGGYRLRPGSFLLSAAGHCLLLFLVAAGPHPEPIVKRPIYDSVIRPNEKKIIWYRKLPEITPPKKISDAQEPRGAVRSNSVTIAMSPKPASSRQIILQAAPKIKLEQDLKAPNLLALAPRPPSPPQPRRPRAFVPPPAPARPSHPEDTFLQPGQAVILSDANVPGPPSLPQQKRAFIAPPQGPKLPVPQTVVLEGPADLSAATGPLPSGIAGLAPRMKAPARTFTPPSGGRSSGQGSGSGYSLESPPDLSTGSNLNTAIIGLNPSDQLNGLLPAGARPGQFSAAPNVGKTATGDLTGSGGISAPDVLVRPGKNPGGKPTSPGSSALEPHLVLYEDTIPQAIRPTLSAPLRPASRTIPRALESRFNGRFVYTLVIPAPNLPAYSGDWIIWFAERSQKSGEPAVVRAPIPYRKLEPAEKPPIGDRSEARVQLAAVLKPDGRFELIDLVKSINTAIIQSAIEDLKRWEFRPAMRNGSPIEVDVVIEIPFSSASLLAGQ